MGNVGKIGRIESLIICDSSVEFLRGLKDNDTKYTENLLISQFFYVVIKAKIIFEADPIVIIRSKY